LFATGGISLAQLLGCSLSLSINWRRCEQHRGHRNRRTGDL
jgi:hypothetical protein